MVTRILVFLLVFVPVPGVASNEIRAGERVGAFPDEATSSPVDDLLETCPPIERGACAHGYPVLDRRCEVVETRELGVFGDSPYFLRRTVQTLSLDDGGGEPYECRADGVELIRMPDPGHALVVWRDATERDFVFISDVALHRAPVDRSVLSILYCMNGTGGCTQGSLIWSGSAWRELERDASWEAVYRRLPAGYRQHKSPPIDFENLTWEQHLAGPSDPNCCPTGTIDFRLAIVDDRLSVRSYRIRVPPEESTAEAHDRLMARSASEFDPALPAGRLEDWLRDLLPVGVALGYRTDDCGEHTAAPLLESGRTDCLTVAADLVSRARDLELSFGGSDLAYRGGVVFSDELEGTIHVDELGVLSSALKKPLRTFPPSCPEGTTPRLEENHAGSREWCEDPQGRRQGPYRSWFSTGIYLMQRGQYRDDAKFGEWVECDRFERCEIKTYE